MRLHPRAAVALAGLALVTLAGCATQPPAVDTATADTLNTSVVAVATAAAGGDPVAAIAQLDALQAQLDAAVAGETVTAERAADIQASIDLIRLDLQALVAALPTPTPTPTPTDDEDDKPGKPEKPGKPGKDDDED